ncbi:MAG: methylenetetrahydrofolate reductase [NAD(P)H] [Oscillospiraceae bacterium]|nr:methylenetetrahydrofolate reductase [NAD(P)H] [Oscillospiraceae bacterium]
MKIRDMFEKGTVFSFEIFPPKKTAPVEIIYNTLEELKDLKPDFISVTYGAGGSGNNVSTCEIAQTIRDKYGIEPAAHLPCINYTKDEITAILKDFEEHGIENILALRGDINPDIPPKKEFKYASELVEFIKSKGDFDIAGACYPEGHVDTPDMVQDVLNLKKKVDAGASHLISQLFFDNQFFYSFVEKAKIAGINVPIEAGIMPVTNKKSIERMVSMCGASLPPKFAKMMQKYENNPEALRDAGIAYAIDQIVDLVSNGVDGIHLYTMNNAYVARRISEAVGNIIRG